MANFIYNEKAYLALLAGSDLTQETRGILVMTNSNADVSREAQTVSAITTLDEFDGSGYTSGGIAIPTPSVARDPGNNGALFDGDDIVWNNVDPGSRNIKALLVILWKATLGNSIPLAYVDTGGFPVTPNGGNITVQWNAAGIITARSAA